jgi:hypothetical protein
MPNLELSVKRSLTTAIFGDGGFFTPLPRVSLSNAEHGRPLEDGGNVAGERLR